MKLTAIILTITFLNVQAAGLSQTVTISGNNILLEKVFTVIKQQTGYMFLYTADVIKDAKKVSLHVKDATLEEVLNLVLKDQPLGYHIANNTIIISKKKEPVENKPSGIAPPGEVKGRVLNHKGEPLAGANVKVKGTAIGGVTNADGFFVLKGVEDKATIEISYLGFETQTVKLDGQSLISVQLKLAESELAAVSVSVFTGYQQVPKERATGSFVQVDNKLLNRGASYDVLSRLEGVVSGLAFYRNSKTEQPTLNIRGRSTIFAELQPLIVVDNFPYDGDITNINPNTIESITILRDAAAASIYGVRSANGVIVITTKKGNSNTPPQVSFNTNVTMGARPDLNYFPLMSSEDFIDAEKAFFSKGWYTTAENSLNKFPVTPVVELLIKKRDGLISAADADQQIEALKQHNLTDEFDKHFLRNRVLLQNSLSVSGGGNNSRYFMTLSYDKDQSSYVNNGFDRYSINTSYSFTPFKNIEINTALLYTNIKLKNNNPGINELVSLTGRKYYPYAQLIDEDNGYALPVNYGFQATYKALKESQGFLDWQYRPVDELNLADNTSQQNYNKVNIELRKTFSSHFNIELKYQYEKQLRKDNSLSSLETYFTRDLINKYYNPAAIVKYPVPLGGIFDQTVSELEGHTGRVQANFNQKWQQHRVSAIGGFEVKQREFNSNQSRLYGYNDETITSQVVDYATKFPTNPAGTSVVIPYPREVKGTLDRYLSYYANASYTYNDRYVFSASGRLDNTNYFGIKSNQRIVPLWSMGVKWNLNREDFFETDLFDQLALKATYGYNGNINKGQTAYTTVRYVPVGYTAAIGATVVNPPNPELRWERSNMFNAGVVFALKKYVLSGTIEYFSKKGKDIIGDAVMDPTTGLTSFRGNMANIQGQGVDVQLTGKIIINKFSWNPTVLFSHATDKVSNYTKTFLVPNIIQQGSGDLSNLMTPYNGYPVLAIYSFAWGGLDPITGDPLGVLDDLKTNNYTNILNNTTHAEMVYHGPVNPPIIGAFRNDFHWNDLSLSVNITYKFGHFFRRPNLDYGSFVNWWTGNKDFVNRWQKPGDEAITNVPSLPGQYPTQGNIRDFFYSYSEILVQKADHIRLQDIVLSYDFDKAKWGRLRCQNLHVYCNINNIGILWRANKYGIDPDAVPNANAQFLPQPRSVTLGAKLDF